MIYKRFGKTEISMPVISFGCMRSMHSWQDSANSNIPAGAQDSLAAILRQALDNGINHIETAHGYGSSERQLGKILRTIPRKEFILQTKVTPSDDPEEFLAKVKLSMERLQVSYLDLLAIHGINDHRSLWQSCRKNGCLAAARLLQDKGLVGHVGFSGHGACEVILQALAHKEDEGFEFANIHWYYIFDANRRAVEFAADQDIGVFIISPSDKGGYLHTPAPELVKLCTPLSPMLFNGLYCLQQHGVCTISVGASEPHHFDEHLKVLPYLENNDTSIVSSITARLSEELYEKTGYRRPDTLWDILPPWDQAPGNINLRVVLWLYNLYRGWGMRSYSQDRYAMLGKGSSWIPGNNGSHVAHLDFSGLTKIDELSPDKLADLLTQAHHTLKKKKP
ncbi:MAG: aldo/keto reductase [Deltaproteobacteria bacterium]|nr:aldo/keto reductase [Deltaproteobacteria bacterium]